MDRKLVMKNIFAIFSCSLCITRKREIKIKAFEKKRLLISIDIQKSPILRHPNDKVGSITSFSS